MPAKKGQNYGRSHRMLRKKWARVVAAGGVTCARCGLAIVEGMPWDPGHHDSSCPSMLPALR